MTSYHGSARGYPTAAGRTPRGSSAPLLTSSPATLLLLPVMTVPPASRRALGLTPECCPTIAQPCARSSSSCITLYRVSHNQLSQQDASTAALQHCPDVVHRTLLLSSCQQHVVVAALADAAAAAAAVRGAAMSMSHLCTCAHHCMKGMVSCNVTTCGMLCEDVLHRKSCRYRCKRSCLGS